MTRPPKGKARRAIERLSARIVATTMMAITRLLPLSWCRGIGAVWVPAFMLITWRRQKLADENLVKCFGDRFTAKERRAIRRGVTGNICKLFPELFKVPTLSAEELRETVLVENVDILHRALERGKGAIFLTAHYGNWEVLGARGQLEGLDMAVVARDASDAGATSIINRARGGAGVRILGVDDVVGMIRHLRKNGILAILPDQHAASGAVLCEFLGRPAWCTKGPATLALRTGCAIVPCFVVREKGDLLRSRFKDEILPPDEPDRDKAVAIYTQAIMDVIGEAITERPEQWLWTHNRWKDRQDAEAENQESE